LDYYLSSRGAREKGKWFGRMAGEKINFKFKMKKKKLNVK